MVMKQVQTVMRTRKASTIHSQGLFEIVLRIEVIIVLYAGVGAEELDGAGGGGSFGKEFGDVDEGFDRAVLVVLFGEGEDKDADGFGAGSDGDGIVGSADLQSSRGVGGKGDLVVDVDVAFVDDADLELVSDQVFGEEIRGTGHARGGDAQGFDGAESEGKDDDADGEKDGVKEGARAQVAGFAALQADHGIEAHQSGRSLEADHDVVAGIHAGGAADAFHLQAVANVDPGGADLDTTQAVNAVAGRGVGGGFATGFAANFVVTNDDGVVVGQGGLESAIGAEDDAELFTEPAEGKVDGTGEEEHDAEREEVLRGRTLHPLVEGAKGDEVGDEDVRDEGR